MEVLLEELQAGMLDERDLIRFSFRLTVATLLGAIVGYQRQIAGKDAGLRTHMLVAAGAALLVAAPQGAGMDIADLSRVIEGAITGIGFLGAGAILKREDKDIVLGLTTAAGIWLTAAIGLAVGIGQIAVAALGTVLGWFVLASVGHLERRHALRSERTIVTEDDRRAR